MADRSGVGGGKKDDDESDDDVDEATLPSGACCRAVCRRYRQSTLHDFLIGKLTYEDADSAVNTISVVAALMLTIPFSILGSFNSDYWDGE